MADSTTASNTSAQSFSTMGGNFKDWLHNYATTNTGTDRFLSRFAGNEPEEAKTEKEFVLANIDALLKAINNSTDTTTIQNRKSITYDQIISLKLIQDTVTLEKINAAAKALKSGEQISISNPTKEHTVTIININGVLHAFEANAPSKLVPKIQVSPSQMEWLYDLLYRNEIRNAKAIKNRKNPGNYGDRPSAWGDVTLNPQYFMKLWEPSLEAKAKTVEARLEEDKEWFPDTRNKTSNSNAAKNTTDLEEFLGPDNWEKLKQLVNNNTIRNAGSIEIVTNNPGVINISYIKNKLYAYTKIPTDKTAEIYNAYKQSENPPAGSETSPPVSPEIKNVVSKKKKKEEPLPVSPEIPPVPSNDFLLPEKNINFLRRYENILKRFE